MNILHIADLHLGARLSGFTMQGKKHIRKKIEEAKINLENLAKNPAYDGIVLVGDILDSKDVSPYHIKYLENLFKEVLDRGVFVVYATGNHDYFISEKHFSKIIDNPIFILFTKELVERREIVYKNQKIAFYGIGYQNYHTYKDLTGLFPMRQDEDIAIAALHGDVSSGYAPIKSDYHYISSKELASKKYDYVALGHIHSYTDFGSGIYYSGCPFGQGMDEIGEKYLLSADIEREKLNVSKKVISPYKIFDIEINMTCKDRYELAEEIKSSIRNASSDSFDKLILRIKGTVFGFEDYLNTDDMEFRESIFGLNNPEIHKIDLEIKKSAKHSEIQIPSQVEIAMDRAIEYFETIDYAREIISQEGFKEELLDMMKYRD